MQFLAEQWLHGGSTGSGTLKPENANADDRARTEGRLAGQMRRWAQSRKWQWAIGAACAAGALLLFGLFRSRPLPEPRMDLQAGSTALHDGSAAAMKTAPMRQLGIALDAAPGAVRGSGARAEMLNDALPFSSASASAPPGAMIARTVSLTIQVKDLAGSRSTLDAILARYQGYAAELNVNTPENAARSFGASLRIPAPALAAALADLRRLGRVQSETQSGEEVTQQHTDLVARLRNARETEQRLLAILQKKTGKVAEVLEVEEQISNTRGEIERMEAELQALEHRVDFATVQLQLAEEFRAQLNPPSPTVGTRMQNAIVAGLGNAGDSILGILLFLEEYGPVLLVWFVVLGTPAWLVWRRFRRAEGRA